MNNLTVLSIEVYALAIAISLTIAALIKGIVLALPLMTRQEPAAVPGPPTVPAIPAAHVAAISAAVAVLFGERHIVHIEDRGRGAVWTAEGRMLHQTSHSVSHNPPSARRDS